MTDPQSPTTPRDANARAYWQANIRAVIGLLLIWAAVSFGFGVLLADWLNRFRLPGSGFPLGFWFAQQGSIYTFVVLIFVYVWIMRRLDRRFGVEEASTPPPAKGGEA